MSAVGRKTISIYPRRTLGMRHTFSWLLLIFANTLWACSYVAAKFALRDTSVNMMNALRMILSALILLPLLIVLRKDLNLTRRDLPATGGAGAGRLCHQ